MNLAPLVEARFVPALAVLLPLALPAQNVFHGNGIPSAYVQNSPAVLGQQLTFRFGSPTTALPVALLAISDGIGPVVVPHPLFGTIGLDVLSPAYLAIGFALDAVGDATVNVPLPPGFLPPSAPPLFAHAATVEGQAFSISKTVRIDWANADGWEATAPLVAVRQLHTATPLASGPRDNVTEVLLTGGATNSFVVPVPIDTAELFSPLTRTTTSLPTLSLPRASHRAVRLPDGRVLITGGVTTGGLVTATCEFFDQLTHAFVPAPSMNAPRAGHALTLLDDGRVLASGGVSDWRNTATAFIAALNTAQQTAEVFDPVANTWTPLPNMAAKRLGHSQTKLADGRVLVVSGIRGGYTGAFFSNGQIPQYTSTCEVFDPVTNTFAPTGSLTAVNPTLPSAFTFVGRAFHGASLLPSGNVLVTGGFVAQQGGGGWANDDTIPVAWCSVWNATAGAWSQVASLPAPAAFHGHEPFRTGAIVCGGFTAGLTQLLTTAQTVFHDGATVTVLGNLGVDGAAGTAQPRGAHSLTPLHDGTFFVAGGGVWPGTLGSGWVYTPQ
jgi:hypothetical protein